MLTEEQVMSFIDSWDINDTIDDNPDQTVDLNMGLGHQRNESRDLFIREDNEIPQEMLEELYGDEIDDLSEEQ